MYGSSCGYVYVSAGILQRPEVTDSPGTGVTRIASCPTLCRKPQSPGSVNMVSLTSDPYLKSSVLILIHYTAKCAFSFREQRVATGSHPHPGAITPPLLPLARASRWSWCVEYEQKWYVAFPCQAWKRMYNLAILFSLPLAGFIWRRGPGGRLNYRIKEIGFPNHSNEEIWPGATCLECLSEWEIIICQIWIIQFWSIIFLTLLWLIQKLVPQKMYSYNKGLLLADYLGGIAQGQMVLGW